MRIEKRISFSLDGVWTEWCFRRHARKRISVSFTVWLISLGCNSGTPFYLNRQERVNTILSSFPRTIWIASAAGGNRCRRLRRATRRVARAAGANSVRDRSLITCRRSRNFCGREDFYGLGGGVGRGLAVGPDLGVGVGLGVGVAVAVPVAVAWRCCSRGVRCRCRR